MQKHNGTKTKRAAGLLLVTSSWLLMGNQSCQQAQTQQRVLARKVAAASVQAPAMTLPAAYGSTFDFATVASSQMQAILPTTAYFSTANIDQNADYSPAGLAQDISNQFQVCTNEVPSNQTVTTVAASQVMVRSAAAKANLGANISMSYYASCMVGMPQAVLHTSINDFSLVSSAGANISTSNMSTLTGASLQISNYALQVEMLAKNPLDLGNSTQVAVINNTYSSSTSLGLTLNLGMFSLGTSGYYQTPLAQITSAGLTKAVTDLASSWSSQDPWFAQVLKACGSYIYINGSSDLGLKVGDVLAVKNVMNEWYGQPCASQWAGDVPDVTPVVYVQVVSLGDNISAAQIIKGNANYPVANSAIYPGARVYMYQTADQVAAVSGLPVPATATSSAAGANSSKSSSSSSSTSSSSGASSTSNSATAAQEANLGG